MFKKKIEISPKEYWKLKTDSHILSQLEANGVDNWEGYELDGDDEFEIIINGETHYIDALAISYEDIVKWARKDPKILYSITYGHKDTNDGGTLTPKEEVLVKDGTFFNICFTGNA